MDLLIPAFGGRKESCLEPFRSEASDPFNLATTDAIVVQPHDYAPIAPPRYRSEDDRIGVGEDSAPDSGYESLDGPEWPHRVVGFKRDANQLTGRLESGLPVGRCQSLPSRDEYRRTEAIPE